MPCRRFFLRSLFVRFCCFASSNSPIFELKSIKRLKNTRHQSRRNTHLENAALFWPTKKTSNPLPKFSDRTFLLFPKKSHRPAMKFSPKQFIPTYRVYLSTKPPATKPTIPTRSQYIHRLTTGFRRFGQIGSIDSQSSGSVSLLVCFALATCFVFWILKSEGMKSRFLTESYSQFTNERLICPFDRKGGIIPQAIERGFLSSKECIFPPIDHSARNPQHKRNTVAFCMILAKSPNLIKLGDEFSCDFR